MKHTKVVHFKKSEYDIYIGRPSKWGNPFEIGVDGTRDEVIEKYRKHVLGTPELFESLSELKGLVLGCWCHPKPCHGDVLVDLVNIYVLKNNILEF
jgi:hypothetical protein